MILNVLLTAVLAPSPWATVDRMHAQTGFTIAYEWYGEQSASVPQPLKDEPAADWLKRSASSLDRRAIVSSSYASFQSKWVPPMLRYFDVLADWSGREKPPSKGSISQVEGYWTISLRPGETLSLRTLQAHGLKLNPLPYSLADVRLIVRSTRASTKTLLDAIAAVVGGRVDETSSGYGIRLDAGTFRSRRLLQASEHLRRVPNDDSISMYSIRIEAEALPKIKDQDLVNLYSTITQPHLIISATNNPALTKAIETRLQMALETLPASARDKLKPQNGSELSAWASSTGGFGGVVMVADGLPWYF